MSVPETPYTRGEMYLSAIADGDSSGIPERPYTRKEMYLDAIARGDSSGIPERPYTREEMYLDAIAKNGGGGGGGGGSSSLSGLTDVDISNPTDGQTLVYNATSGKWENGAGGLPAPTAEDVGKVMRVKNGNESTLTTVVPTQTVEFTGEPVELENAVISVFTAGAECIATINGKTYNGIASFVPGEIDSMQFAAYDDQTGEGYFFWVENGALYFAAESEEISFTVSLAIKTYNAVWSKDFSFDLIIHLNEYGLAQATGATIINGSFADIAPKLAKGMPALIWVDGHCVNNVVYDSEQNEIGIELLNYAGSGASVYVATTSGGSPTTKVLFPSIGILILTVHSDNTVTGWWDE